MYHHISIDLLNLILSLSDALDLANPDLSQHQLRTAYIAWEMGKAAGLPAAEIDQLFIASLLHDVGAFSLEDKLEVQHGKIDNPEIHCILGERALNQLPLFERSSRIVRFHHTEWQTLQERSLDPILFSSQILYLADTLEKSVDRKTYILHQDRKLFDRICTLKGTAIDPNVVQIFESIAVREDFWLDLVSPRLYSLLLHDGPSRNVELDFSLLKRISELFRNLIDFRSSYTSTHSTGVATSSSTISRFLGLTEIEIGMMEVAGNLHDLGKMVIPNSILEKPDKLNAEETAIMRQHTYITYTVLNTIGGTMQIAEWAALHHERLDGSGYPFHLKADKLGIGSRIMAVADIFTALAEDRPYRKGLNQSEVLSILQKLCAKNFIDGGVLRILEENYNEILSLMQEKQGEVKRFYEENFVI